MVKCKNCPKSEMSLRREAKMHDDNEKHMPLLYLLYCRFLGEHVNGHKERECKEGTETIEREGPKKIYPFT